MSNDKNEGKSQDPKPERPEKPANTVERSIASDNQQKEVIKPNTPTIDRSLGNNADQ